MNLIGKKVVHRKFGQGEISSIEGSRIEINFTTTIKTFLFPDAFESYVSLSDQEAGTYVDGILSDQKNQKQLEKEQQHQRLQANAFSNQKKPDNAQAIFAMNTNDLDDVLVNWTVNTGYYLSGKSKGMPKIPLNMGISSCCILTDKEDGEGESKRTIAALMMAEDRFIGKECKTGLITAHEAYRITWNESNAPLYLWNYFPEDLRPKSWGGAEVKYTSKTIIKAILEDMAEQSEGDDKNKILNFQKYFCKMNSC